jgi:hypothetical protein
MTLGIGFGDAAMIGDIHEATNGVDRLSTEMDLFNNKVGREIGAYVSTEAAAWQRCTGAANSGGLQLGR